MPIRFTPSLSPTWSPQFPVRRPSSFAVQAVAPDAPAPAAPPPASMVQCDPAAGGDGAPPDDQRAFAVFPTLASTPRYDERSVAVFPTLASTFFSITMDLASDARGTGSSVEEYRPKGADV